VPEGLRELFPVTVLLERVETEEIRLRLRKENESRTGMTINVAGDLHLGDNFAADVIGVAGNGSQVRDVSVTHVEMLVDLLALADELVELKAQMLVEAIEPHHYSAVSEVAHAEQAARDGDESKTLRLLRSAGNWVWEVGTRLGENVALDVARGKLNL
jgi:hypothetical protein